MFVLLGTELPAFCYQRGEPAGSPPPTCPASAFVIGGLAGVNRLWSNCVGAFCPVAGPVELWF